MKKIIASLLILFLFTSIVLAENSNVDLNTKKTKETQKSENVEKSKNKTITKEKAEEKGIGITHNFEQGFKQSEIKSLSKALEKLRSKGITFEVSVISLVFMQLSKLYPSIFNKTINNFYKVEIIDDYGYINNTAIEYLNKVAQAQSSTKYLNTKKVVDYMEKLISISYQIQNEIKALDGEIFGLEDYNEIARDIAKKIDINKRASLFTLSNKCVLIGSYEKIKCGNCLLDISNTKATPNLYCSGLEVFSNNSVLGYTVKAIANASYSFKDVESEIKNTEIYKSISNAVESYAKKMEKKGIAVNKTILKKLLMEKAIKNSKEFNLALLKMQKEENPRSLFNFLK